VQLGYAVSELLFLRGAMVSNAARRIAPQSCLMR
jgi:hypothetical protein